MNQLMVLTELIEHELAAVTEADIERAERNMDEPAAGEADLGLVENLQARRLFALCGIFLGRRSRFASDAHFAANSEEEKRELLKESARADSFDDMARQIFWCQVKDDLSLWHLRDAAVALRRGWRVAQVKKPEMPEFLRMFRERLPGGE